MFDLVTGEARHMPPSSGSAHPDFDRAQIAVATVALIVPFMYVTDTVPDVPTMMAFVAAPARHSLRRRRLPRCWR
jgi:hypothetical protein